MKTKEQDLTSIIDECNAEIARLELLLERQRELKSSVNEERLLAIRRADAPVAKAPDDVLLLIFE